MFLIGGIFFLQGQTDQELVTETVTKNAIEGNIYFLTDDLLQGRETGSRGLKIAASYLANWFRTYGVRPNPQTQNYYQEVPLEKVIPSHLNLEWDGQEGAPVIPLKSTALDFEGNAVFIGYGLEDDYKGQDVTGKIVLLLGGNASAQDVRTAWGLRQQKEALARKYGALGMVELVQAEGSMWNYLDQELNTARYSLAGDGNQPVRPADFNYLWVRDAGGEKEAAAREKGKVPLKFKADGEIVESVTSQNVIGWVEGTDPVLKNEYIIYSAHYDHLGVGKPDAAGDSIYNGARDNAVGTTTVLSMAENLAKYPTKRSALFILFTAEEKGLLGSKYYVEHPVFPLEQMVYCFNSDNGGYNNTKIATIIGLTRTTAEADIKKAVAAFGLEAIEDPAPEEDLFNRSDNVYFARKGIPAPTFSLGFDAFDDAVNQYYHQPGDEADTLDYDYLLQFFRAYVYAGRLLANDPHTPFWVPGDPYEAAGKTLYGN